MYNLYSFKKIKLFKLSGAQFRRVIYKKITIQQHGTGYLFDKVVVTLFRTNINFT